MNWLGTLLSGISGGIGNIGNAIGSALLNGIKGGLSKLAGLFVSAFNFAVSLVGKTLAGIGKIGGEALGALSQAARSLAKGALYVLAGAVAGVAVSAQKAISATLEWSKSLGNLRASTGLSVGAASGVQSRFGAVGLDASSMLAGQNPQMYGLRASMWGVPSYTSPDFLAKAAGRFQSLNSGGITGNLLAQQMAKSLGMGDADSLRALSTPVGELRSQQAFAGRAQAAFNLDPAAIATTSRHFEQLTTRVQILGQTAALAIGQRLLPTLTRWADGALRIVEHFSSQGSDLLGQGIDLMVSGIGRAFEAMVTFGRFLYADAPALAFKFVDAMIGGLQAVASAAPVLWDSMLQGINMVQSVVGPAFEWLTQTIPPIFDMLVRGVSAAAAGIGELVKRAPELAAALSKVFTDIAAHPLVKAAMGSVRVAEVLAAPGAAIEKHVTGEDSGVGGWLSAAGIAALVRSGLSSLVGGGGGGGGGGGWLGKVLLSDLALVPTLGGIAGGLAHNYITQPLQRALGDPLNGMLGGQLGAGAVEAGSNAWARIRNVVTGADWDLNVTNGSGHTPEAEARLAARAAGQAGSMPDILKGVTGAAANAYDRPTGMSLSGIGASLSNAYNGAPSGSWAHGLDDRMGGGLRSGAARAQEELEKLRDNFREKFGGYQDAEGRGAQFDEQVNLLRQVAGSMSSIDGKTGEKDKPMFTDRQVEMMWRLSNASMKAKGTADYVGLISR